MNLFLWIIVFTFAGGVISALIASLYLLLGEQSRQRTLPHFVSFAIGALLGAAFLGLLPHAIESAGMDRVHTIGLTFTLGILLFFILEKAVIWRHCHTSQCEAHALHDDLRDAAASKLILIGDSLHNMIDGVLIGAAFLTDFHLGVVTALAVIAHEIPQEVGDVAVLLNGGFSAKKSFTLNMIAGFTTVLGGILAYYVLAPFLVALPYVLAIAAGSFVYVAVADLIPGLHKQTDVVDSAKQVVFMALGLVVIFFSHSVLH